MIIADGLKRFRRSFHRVVAQRAVDVKIDEAGREIISAKINNLVCARMVMLADCGDFSFFNDDLKAITNSIGKNQTRVRKNHFAPTCKLRTQQSRIPTQKSIAKKHPTQRTKGQVRPKRQLR